MVKIRLKRLGATKRPFYRVVVADARSPRDGRFIEQIGKYHPMEDPSFIEIDGDRALYWLNEGAQPTDAGPEPAADPGRMGAVRIGAPGGQGGATWEQGREGEGGSRREHGPAAPAPAAAAADA